MVRFRNGEVGLLNYLIIIVNNETLKLQNES